MRTWAVEEPWALGILAESHYLPHWAHQKASTRFQGKNNNAIASVVISFLPSRAKILREYAGWKESTEENTKTKWTKTSGIEVEEKLKQRREGHKNKSKVQHLPDVASVWTEWAHQLSENSQTCPDETRKDFLIIVSQLTKGKSLKRRSWTVNTEWRELRGEGLFPILWEECRGMWEEKDLRIGQLVQTVS